MVRAAFFAAALLAVSFPAVADRDDDDRDRHHDRDRERSFDPVYNVCRGTDQVCYNDWGVQGRKANRVLIWSRTAGPRHAALGTALAPGLNPPLGANNVMQANLVRLLAAEGIQADWTEDVTVMTNLGAYKAVIFASSNRDNLWNSAATVSNDAARTALRQFIRAGNGFVAIHNAFGAEYQWTWYEGLLGNANFYDHGPNRDGVVEIIAHDSSTTGAGLPPRTTFAFVDEWYNLVPFPTRVKFLAKVKRGSLNPPTGSGHPGHPNFHPLSWCQYYDGGRAWLTTLGHNADSYRENSPSPGAAQFQRHIVEGIKSVMGLTRFCD